VCTLLYVLVVRLLLDIMLLNQQRVTTTTTTTTTTTITAATAAAANAVVLSTKRCLLLEQVWCYHNVLDVTTVYVMKIRRKYRNNLRVYIFLHTKVWLAAHCSAGLSQGVQYLRNTGVSVLPLGAAAICTLWDLRYTAQWRYDDGPIHIQRVIPYMW